MQMLTYDVAHSLSRSSRTAFTRTYALSILAFGVAIVATVLLGG